MGDMTKTFKHGVTGYRNRGCRCDVCRADKAAAAAKYRAANKEKATAYAAKYRAANKEKATAYASEYYAANKDRIAARQAEYSAANRGKRAARSAAYRKANSETVKAKKAAYRKANPDKRAAQKHRRRARQAGNGIYTVTDRDITRLKQRHHHECFYCGTHDNTSPLTIDHITPIARGGRHSIGNLIPSCRQCNSSKNARLLSEWKKYRG